MTTNNSQIGNSPSTPSLENNASQSNINLLLLDEIHTTNESTLQFNEINMIPSQIPMLPNPSEHDNLTQRQETRRRRRQRQRQRRRERQELLRQERLQQQQQQRHHRQRNRQRRQQQHQWLYESRRGHYNDFSEHPNPFEEPMDVIYNEPFLEAYMWGRMDPMERWEQEQINDLEGFAALEQLILMQDELEQSEQIDRIQRLKEEEEQTKSEQEQSQLKQWEQEQLIEQNRVDIIAHIRQIEDDIEQLEQIEAVQHMQDEIDRKELHQRQKEPNDVQLFQFEQWEHVTFLVQQLNQN
ncbi:unnamed protein product [Adineta steineri]|uniref:Uncharacterized protein n=1 Tax=Adineta steineri TaxID=433720 RepID=A0A819SIM4_9BILA|nr:unnamed protein product [Adineta steineri]CAF4063502.1 unnamed protein product [Adineta steineri]